MKILKTIAALLICFSSFRQGKTFYNIIKPNGDTTLWFKYITKRANKLSLPLLDNTLESEHVRIWTNTQVIDIWQDNTGSLFGKLTTWTDEHVDRNEEPTNRTFIKSKPITFDAVRLLRKLLTLSNVLVLPTEDSIKGWQQGFDGITYIIEHSTKDTYSFKSYWTPKAQGSLKEAMLVQAFVDSAFSIVNAQTFWQEFSKQIPFESYYNGGPEIAIRILTEKEQKKYKKERKKYRQQQLGKSRSAKYKLK
ncbi:hypothetical protein HUW51_03520 [Adhaeribacter swui]|uniref:GLPGLI family protein n=1 Tax=Adhaeribacter swui TaxID=2086471 RepID=A0A7G7G3U8_9BACT|nr:hypothetical protein [Adhaeribacter swui]QNF31832.1 hypothetical protein HUW51_03520 [Adhaeribacter swui]